MNEHRPTNRKAIANMRDRQRTPSESSEEEEGFVDVRSLIKQFSGGGDSRTSSRNTFNSQVKYININKIPGTAQNIFFSFRIFFFVLKSSETYAKKNLTKRLFLKQGSADR